MNNTTIFSIKSKIDSKEAQKTLSYKEQYDLLNYRHRLNSKSCLEELVHTIKIK